MHIPISTTLCARTISMRMACPNPTTQKNLAAGQELYLKSCANCHGQNGQADTPLAENLEPAPPTLTVLSKRMDGEMMGDGQMMEMGSVEDGYLFWVLEKGGQPTGSAMPATENSLSDTERWQIIHYLRSGLTTDG